MANDLWTTLSPISTPAASDRIGAGTGPNAGGYSLRGDFIWKRAGGEYLANGPVVAGFAGADTTYNAGFYGRAPAGGTVDWDFKTNDATYGARTAFTVTAAGNIGVGVTAPAARIHALSISTIARFGSTAARGAGNCLVDFADPTGRKGYLGYGSGVNDSMFLINDLAWPMYFGVNASSQWQINGGHFLPATDNAHTVGNATFRPAQLFASTNVIGTSDEREKTWRGGLTADELRAAKRIVAELGFFQWNDAVAEKGEDGARLHFGVRAQQVWAIMADEGLVDPIEEGVAPSSKYAFLCYDRWDEQIVPEMEAWRASNILGPDGNPVIVKCEPEDEGAVMKPTGERVVEAGDRFGIRPDQLALFLIAAQEARLAALEAA